jgi:hypothetical protein
VEIDFMGVGNYYTMVCCANESKYIAIRHRHGSLALKIEFLTIENANQTCHRGD